MARLKKIETLCESSVEYTRWFTMETWRLLDLGSLPPLEAQTLYEAVAIALDKGLVPSTVILCNPAAPYACLGFHQEIENEIDIEFCQRNNLPIIRRSQGGGATYLDGDQQFYQIIADEQSLVVPYAVDAFFEKFLQPTVYTYNGLGVPAEYKPINDVVVSGRKISGNGAGKMGKSAILVGNVILDLDYDSMTRVLKVPDEKFRDKLAKSIREWVTSLKRELGYIPPKSQIKKLFVEGYEKIGVNLVSGTLSNVERKIFDEEVRPKHLSREWLYMPEYRHPELVRKRAVKVAGDVKVVEANYKAKKMIRVTMEVAFNKIRDILISGDFFIVPETMLPKLETELIGVPLNHGDVLQKVKKFYGSFSIQSPGVEPEDIVNAIMSAVSE